MIAALLLALALPAQAGDLAVTARAVRQGELLLVQVDDASPTPPAGSLLGKDLHFFRGGDPRKWLAFAALDLAAAPGRTTLTVTRAGVAETWPLTVVAGRFPVSRLKVPPQYVEPPAAEKARIDSESARLLALFKAPPTPRLFSGRFVSPIPGAQSARFGERRVFNGQSRDPHSGADLRAAAGTPVKAPADGKVLLAEDLYYAGNSVLLDHGAGLTTFYAHLSKISVAVGQSVTKGQVLGEVGATGRVTGPHLHWAAKLGAARIDPFSLTWLDLDAALAAPAPSKP